MEEASRENIAGLLPVITAFEKPFWDSLKHKQLMIQKCGQCNHVQFPPSPVCTDCLSENVQWTTCSSKARLWSKVAFHKGYLAPYGDIPYYVVLAKLEEGPIVTGRMHFKTASVTPFDAPLRAVYTETIDGTVLLEFVPA